MDGNGNFYLFDMRTESNNVYGVHSGNIGWADDECFFMNYDIYVNEELNKKNSNLKEDMLQVEFD